MVRSVSAPSHFPLQSFHRAATPTLSSRPSARTTTMRPRRFRPVRPILCTRRMGFFCASKQTMRSTSPMSRPSSPTQVDTSVLKPPWRNLCTTCHTSDVRPMLFRFRHLLSLKFLEHLPAEKSLAHPLGKEPTEGTLERTGRTRKGTGKLSSQANKYDLLLLNLLKIAIWLNNTRIKSW